MVSGPVGFHIGTTLGESFLVEDLLGLGAPLVGARIDGVTRPEAQASARASATTPATPAAMPERTAFLGARPTPFRGSTSLAFDLAHEAEVTIEVWNVRGARVRGLAHGTMAAGRHAMSWDGRDDAGRRLAAGLYWVRFAGDGVRKVAKAVIVE